ncbi:hypothetical protein D2L64_09070 [Micromonospora radicis]|uniref:Uncharacterized protein n=2 Tax=Micromonospora radicis TaxID=1894971 RepID=A0A418MXD5_9ACTN|nr:hypothetical protein D2L64_09070 [Micromonospora radicis]
MCVTDMWACLQDHQTDQHWRHVAGWRKVCDLAGQHLTRLRTYRAGLARAWPPETNAAARAYLTELDQLIEQVQRTHDAAAANQTALSAATQAITSTRSALQKIHEEYAGKLQQKRSWEQTAADPKAAAASRASQPPVTDADLEQLNVQARGIMYGLSSELQQAQVMLRQPPQPPRAQPSRDQPRLEGQPFAGDAAPIIPPVVPVPVTTAVRSKPSNPPSPSRSIAMPAAPKTGPVLGGTPAGTVATSATPHSSAPGPPPIQGNPTSSPPLGLRPGIPRLGYTQPDQIGRPSNGGANAAQRPMPIGGLIGGPPSAGLGQPASANTPPRKVNPIGGVIGGGAGTSPTGAAGSRPGSSRGFAGSSQIFPPSGGSPIMNTSSPSGITMPSRTNHHRQNEEKAQHWDPEHPWETDQGISPVIRPPNNEGPIDPGPAIGLKL